MKKATQREILENMMKRPIPKKKVGIIRLEMIKEGRCLYGMERFNDPEMAADMIRPLVGRSGREMFLVMSLDVKLTPLALEIVTVGSVNACFVDMKDVFRHSILNNAARLICFHNHPSGDPTPSSEDEDLIEKVGKCGELLGVELVDHIIIGEDKKYFSFRNAGLLREHVGGDAA